MLWPRVGVLEGRKGGRVERANRDEDSGASYLELAEKEMEHRYLSLSPSLSLTSIYLISVYNLDIWIFMKTRVSRCAWCLHNILHIQYSKYSEYVLLSMQPSVTHRHIHTHVPKCK